MKTTALTLALLFAFNFFSLNAQDSQKDVLTTPPSEEVLSALMYSCYVCHNPRVKSHDDIIAPPLIAVKYMYKFKFPEKEVFVEKMTDFILEPNNQKAILQGPVMKFGAMPDMPMDPTMVRSIAEYIYDNEIEEPVWFPEYFESRHGQKWKGQ